MISEYPARAISENSQLVRIPRRQLLDRVLARTPRREAELATPPPGSGLKPVLGDRGLPFVGNLLKAMRWGPAQALAEYRRVGPVTWSRPLGQPNVYVSGPEATQVVLSNKDKAFGQGWDYYIGAFFDRGLLLLEFDEHMFHRRLMQQAFTRPRLEGYFAELTGLVDKSVAAWPTEHRLLVYPTIKTMTLEIAADIFMDAEVGIERDSLNKAFIACTHGGMAFVRYPIPGGHWRAGLRGRKVLEDYFFRMLPAKRASQDNDMFSALCHARDEDGEQFSDRDVINHMIFLIMAAHDTSTTTATAAAYFLGKHPEWQKKARAESLARGDAPLDMAALETATVLDEVIKETVRLVSPVPGFARRTVKDTEILGHYIPAGVTVSVLHWVNQLLPEYWTDPERFDPDRFSAERHEDKSHRYAWVPFGGGVHKCIGMHFGTLEVKVILDAMLRHYEWSLPQDYEIPWAFSSMPFPVDDAPMVLRRRPRSSRLRVIHPVI
ncbi:cytochrome P450 [Antrihabitans cavernicola]|uniref:Cytochrome P450 n=1 Tax=Antrihabitans cavernicola TaxID=2495913 RepID=A0A5A7S6S9_9NOCA|nr:cytochrome P450 [Spelaeibacter cavernicola]